MHETAIAQQLYKLILVETAKYGRKPIKVKMSCGAFSFVNDELLLEAFNAIIKGTKIENLKLKIEHKPLHGLCIKCGKNFIVDLSNIKCAVCGSSDFDLLSETPTKEHTRIQRKEECKETLIQI